MYECSQHHLLLNCSQPSAQSHVLMSSTKFSRQSFNWISGLMLARLGGSFVPISTNQEGTIKNNKAQIDLVACRHQRQWKLVAKRVQYGFTSTKFRFFKIGQFG